MVSKSTQILTIAFIFTITLLPPTSVGLNHHDVRSSSLSPSKVLGSRPPGCTNKCFNCRPCTATLVIPSHQKSRFDHRHQSQPLSHGQEHDSYYLLSWKCRCGNKLFHP